MIFDVVYIFHPKKTDCCGKFLRYVVTYTFCSVYMTLSTLVFHKAALTRILSSSNIHEYILNIVHVSRRKVRIPVETLSKKLETSEGETILLKENVISRI